MQLPVGKAIARQHLTLKLIHLL